MQTPTACQAKLEFDQITINDLLILRACLRVFNILANVPYQTYWYGGEHDP